MSIYKNPQRKGITGSDLASSARMARHNDPATSHIAAQDMIASGALNSQQEKALELVKRYPNHTSDELAMYGVLDRYALARRLPELEEAGRVAKGAARNSRKTGRPGVTWHLKS